MKKPKTLGDYHNSTSDFDYKLSQKSLMFWVYELCMMFNTYIGNFTHELPIIPPLNVR